MIASGVTTVIALSWAGKRKVSVEIGLAAVAGNSGPVTLDPSKVYQGFGTA